MDAAPAPTSERLSRASTLVSQAAQAGAQLVVLPELFNIGYAYADDNFTRAEPLDGITATWMQRTAAEHAIHLAGTLLLLDDHDISNTMLLYAPDGRVWRYHKLFPWGWERGYFRAGHRIVVAHTDLGAIGMLICWDIAHRPLWRRYAGQVEMMVLCSCPPDIPRATYHFAQAASIPSPAMGRLTASTQHDGAIIWGTMVHEQAAWLGVPAVNTVGSGQVCTPIPRPWPAFLLGMVPGAPWLLRYLPHAALVCNGAGLQDCQRAGADLRRGDARAGGMLDDSDSRIARIAPNVKYRLELGTIIA